MTVFVPAVIQDSAPRFLAGGGEMGALMRGHDWSSTTLGDPVFWPQTLRTMVCLMLNTHHPMYIFWGADSICFYNDAYRQSLGSERHPGSLGQPARAVWGEIWDAIAPQIEQVMSGGGATWHEDELFVITRHGQRRDVYWTYSYSPINQETAPNGVGGVLVVCTETTIAVEARIAEAQRLETLGRLTGGIAHDFNNLLTPIMGSIDVLHTLVDDERAQRIAAGAMQSAERAKILVQRLLAFGRRQTLQTSTVNLTSLIQSMRDVLDRTLGPSITLVIDIPSDLPPVQIDAVQVDLAILNLCINAREAMPSGGQLTISARSAARSQTDNDGLVSLRLTDTGHGMDRETLDRAIEPFFTTKAAGESAGLGLSMVDGLAAQMGGRLVLTSAIGSGTTAELLLPVAATAQTTNAVTRVLDPSPQIDDADRVRIILLVDDEVLVRMTIADDLSDLGYAVVEASSGAEALGLLSDGLVPDMLVTDYRMPGMTGATLIREVRLNLPDLPVLMVTGFAYLAPEETSGFEVLSKPFRKIDLEGRVTALFEASKRIGAFG